MQQLINGIQVKNNMTITLANTKVKDKKFGNWICAVSYMAIQVTEAFGVAKDNKNQAQWPDIEGYQQFKSVDKAVASEGEAVVKTGAEAAGAPMACSSMECTAKTSDDASTQVRCNI